MENKNENKQKNIESSSKHDKIYFITQSNNAPPSLYCVTKNNFCIRVRCADDRFEKQSCSPFYRVEKMKNSVNEKANDLLDECNNLMKECEDSTKEREKLFSTSKNKKMYSREPNEIKKDINEVKKHLKVVLNIFGSLNTSKKTELDAELTKKIVEEVDKDNHDPDRVFNKKNGTGMSHLPTLFCTKLQSLTLDKNKFGTDEKEAEIQDEEEVYKILTGMPKK